ncbi:MAG TPA: hypothetical protein VN844_22330 [Pyrinomonadaceae bacterium]|nr:hypothetical protein [Pyrinomonadaceae bacterium]
MADYSDNGPDGYQLVSPVISERIDRLVTELLVFARVLRLVRQTIA